MTSSSTARLPIPATRVLACYLCACAWSIHETEKDQDPEIYGACLLFFVSARTNKRHHHHHRSTTTSTRARSWRRQHGHGRRRLTRLKKQTCADSVMPHETLLQMNVLQYRSPRNDKWRTMTTPTTKTSWPSAPSMTKRTTITLDHHSRRPRPLQHDTVTL